MRALAHLALLCAVLAGACSSTPPPRYFTLDAAATTAAAPTKLSVAVGPVSVPALVDRPQMVLDAGANQVTVDEFNRWASPLADEITRATVGNLTQLLGGAQVWAAGAGGSADVHVRIDVQDFRSTPGKAVQLDARWSVRHGLAGTPRQGRTRVTEIAHGAGADALAAAHSQALARLAGDLAAAIRAP
jgi:uncharacterized lipoprotein YmbA